MRSVAMIARTKEEDDDGRGHALVLTNAARGVLAPSNPRGRPLPPYTGRCMSMLQQVQADAASALRSGDRERAAALRLVVSELQKATKEAGADEADEIAVLRRERKRRLEAAEVYAEAGRADLAEAERSEAALIEAYLPAELSESELEALVGDAVAESGASSPKEIGRVMSIVMPRVEGRADGRRVSAVVREKLQGAAA